MYPTLHPMIARPGSPRVRTTFQLVADIPHSADASPEQVYHTAVQIVLGWLQGKFPAPLPAEAGSHQSFETELHGQSVRCVSLSEEGIWSARLVQPDAPFADRPAVPGRIWTSELALARLDGSLRFAIRVLCASLAYATTEIALTRPRVVVQLASRLSLSDVRCLDGKPWYIKDEEGLVQLYHLLINRRRTLPVYVLTQPDKRELGLEVLPYLLSECELARQLQGLGRVVALPADLSFRWTEMVGKSWSVFRGAVRTYRPSLRLDEDPVSAHPLALPNRILAFDYQDLRSEQAFSKFLADQAYMEAAHRRIDPLPCLFYADARRRSIEIQRRSAREDDDLHSLYVEEIASLNDKISQLGKETEDYGEIAAATERERDLYIEENRKLRNVNDRLRAALSAKTGQSVDSAVPIPNDYDQLCEWVDAHLVGRLVLHPRARQAVKEAKYENPQLAYKALLLLANEYRNARIGGEGVTADWERRYQELELHFGGSISRERAGEEGDTYFVRFPLHTYERRFLGFHLRKGTSRDERFCLAIYFLWDNDTQQVVVGWLPSHLENRMS